MIEQRMQSAMNEQIMHEVGSAYLYLAMAADFHAKSLDGMAQWMKVQAQEELVHAMRFFDHINDRAGRVELLAIEKPAAKWDSPLAAFQAALEHEEFITGRINELVKIARDENDNAALNMLQWFVNEQIEEEATASKIVNTLTLIGDSGQGLLMLDRELGARVFTPPPPAGADTPAAG
jgi:ferritin